MLIELAQKEFLAEKKFEGLTESSLESYISLFKIFNEWLQTQNIERIDELNPRVVKQYLIYCKDVTKNKPRTINTKLKLLRVFARWLHEEKLLDQEFTENIKTVRQDIAPKIVKDENIRMALRYLRRVRRREDTFYARRNYTLLLFFIGTGMRLSEVERITWDDIDFLNHLITIRVSKSRRTQSVPLSEKLSKELADWKVYQEHKHLKPPRAVFTTLNNKPMSKNSIQLFFKRVKKNVGIEGDFSPHAMRNVYIKNLLKNGANLREVQLLARHSKLEVTRQYIGYFPHELKESLDKNNPLNDLF